LNGRVKQGAKEVKEFKGHSKLLIARRDQAARVTLRFIDLLGGRLDLSLRSLEQPRVIGAFVPLSSFYTNCATHIMQKWVRKSFNFFLKIQAFYNNYFYHVKISQKRKD